MSTVSSDIRAPTVSIVIPCFNAESTVSRTIRSALNQTYGNLEVIVVNDGSTDGSLEAVQQFADRVLIEDGPNRGAGAARNRGVSLAKGEYFHFLDADDYTEPDTIASMVEAAVANEADIVFAPLENCGPGEVREHWKPGDVFDGTAPVQILWGLLNRQFVPPVAILWRGEFLRSIGAWPEGLVACDDAELMFRALFQEPRCAFCDGGLGVYVRHESPHRITQLPTAEAFRCRIQVCRDLSRKIEGTPFEIVKPGLGVHFYQYARRASMIGLPSDITKSAMYEARRCGFKGYPGSRFHSIVASAIGLHNKERLSAAVSRLRAIMGV